MINVALVKKGRFMLTVSVIVLAGYGSSLGQSMCPLETVNIDKVQGKIIVPDEQGSHPLPHTRVELQKLGHPDSLIAAVETDENGDFQIKNIARGKYRLVVHYIVNGIEVVPKFDVILAVRRSYASQSNKYVSVLLTYDCFENQVKVIEVKHEVKPKDCDL
ncbi:MAG: hypothetical protein JSS77_08100 [Acidobacteria bacterium]|nr:hypothetical protein [Acidobacteriota bacterium]